MSPSDPIIAIIGTTGSGKSSFIRALTGSDCQVGHSLRSETTHITTYPLTTASGVTIQLADTPGFDDTTRTDYEILDELVSWLKTNFPSSSSPGQHGIAGIVYMLPINHARLKGSSRRMIRMVQKLLGDQCFSMMLLVTSFWNEVEPEVALAREKELLESEDGWKPFCDGGAKVERLGRDYGRFGAVLQGMVRSRPEQGAKMLVQRELEGGKLLGQTMAALSLNDESGEQEERLRRIREAAVRKEAEKREEAEMARKAMQEEQEDRMREELARQEEEARRVEKQLKSQRRRNKMEVERKRKELEEQTRREAEVRARLAQQKIEAEKRERAQAIEALEKDSALQCQSSRIQERRVGAVIDALRIVLNSGGYPQVVWGIKRKGHGMAGEGPDGQMLPDHVSVERNGMSIWCDYCRVPVGKGVSYVCYPCDMRICGKCRRSERGCLNRAHTLVEDEYWVYKGANSNCRRVQQPELELYCDNTLCHKPIGGFYLHCCCGGREMDFCDTCILSRQARCGNHLHQLYWGVQPLSIGLFSNTNLGNKGLKYPQKTIQVPTHTTQTWLNTSTSPLPLCRSVARYKTLRKQRQLLSEADQKGSIAKVHVDISYCDYCLAPLQSKAHYACTGEHPETGFNPVHLSICQPCHGRGIRCPSLHATVYKPATFTICGRETAPPVFLTCDACKRKMMQEAYFHCCREGDNFDLCVDCVLQGWACPNVTGDHVLKMLHLVAC